MRNPVATLLRSAVEWFEKEAPMRSQQAPSREELRTLVLEILSEQTTAREAAARSARAAGIEGGNPASTIGRLAKFKDTSEGVEDSIVKEVSGKIGIGTDDPMTTLRITHGFAKTDTSLRNMQFSGSNEATAGFPFGLLIRSQGAAALDNRRVDLQTTDFNSASGGLLTLQSGGGKVGIGTAAPTELLHVHNGKIQITRDDASFPLLALDNLASGGRRYTFQSEHTTGNLSIRDSTAGANRLVVSSTGNVGIGTASPSNKLQVMGDARIGGAPADRNEWESLLFGADGHKQLNVYGPEMITGVGPRPTEQDQDNRRVVLWAGREPAPGQQGPEEAMFLINSNGWLEWGPGGTGALADQDIFLARSAPDQLTLTDTFVVAKPNVPGPTGDRQPRIMLKHEGGGIIFGYGQDSAPDIAVFRPSGTPTPNAPGISINSITGSPSPNTFRVNMPSQFVGVEGQELFAVDSLNKAVRVARGESGYAGSESILIVRAVTTTDANLATLASIALDIPRAYYVAVRVVARKSDGTERAFLYRGALVHRESGSTAVDGSGDVLLIRPGAASQWNCTFGISGNNLLVQVQTPGETITVHWVATIELQSVSTSS